MKWKIAAAGAVLLCGALVWGGIEWRSLLSTATVESIPTARVRRGEVTISVTTRGELQGGNTESLSAPMIGGGDMGITFLRSSGELVHAGDIVAKFDTTEQEFRLREAESDLAEAEQQVVQAQAEGKAREEETRYTLLEAEAQVKLAELDCRKNAILAAIVAKQNLLALEAANARLLQIRQDVANGQATSAAAIAIQQAARNKAGVQAATARRNIESMTLKAKSTGYVSVQPNTGMGFTVYGMTLPPFQVGDTARAGMPVAQIPDLSNWEVRARIGELDRGHLAAGQKAAIKVAALPGKIFGGKVKEVGGTSGPYWERVFECKMSIDDPSPELRPGMSAEIVIITEVVPAALWLPSQALFESDGRAFVYLETPSGFMPHDVKLVRRSESQVVLTGVREGQLVALASPDQQTAKSAPASAAKALAK